MDSLYRRPFALTPCLGCRNLILDSLFRVIEVKGWGAGPVHDGPCRAKVETGLRAIGYAPVAEPQP